MILAVFGGLMVMSGLIETVMSVMARNCHLSEYFLHAE